MELFDIQTTKNINTLKRLCNIENSKLIMST